MARVEIGISGIDELDPDGGPARVAAVDRARWAEELGFDSVWVSDVIVGDGTRAVEPIVVLAAVAAATERVRLGFGVLALPVRPVALLAAQLATLQQVSGNRVLLGVGAGGFPTAPFWQAMGVPAGERGRRTDSALAVLPRLIAGEPVRLDDQPNPVRLAPPAAVPPILIGGSSPAAIRRAARYGDGWFPSLIAPPTLATGVARLAELAAGHARPVPRITVGIHYVPAAARDAFTRSLIDDHGLPAGDAEAISVTGGPAQVAEQLGAYVAAGADAVVLAPTGGDWRGQLELLAQVRA